MAFVKVEKRACGGRGRQVRESIGVNSNSGKISILQSELSYMDDMTKGPIKALFMSVEVDVDEKKIRLLPSSSPRDYTIGRKNGNGSISVKGIKGLPTGEYIRVDTLTYEYAGN